jgi:hypothetical protein
VKTLITIALTMVSAAAAADNGAVREFYRPYTSDADGKSVTYTVRKGETLFDIAEKLLGDPYQAKALAKRNGIADPLHLVAGSTIESPAPRLDIRYSLQKLVKDGASYDVVPIRPNERLAGGERFQLRLTANCDGYLYVFNREASGEIRRVFPSSGRKSARVRRFSEYLAPGDGWFRMDDARGDEDLLVLVSLDPLSEFEGELIASGAKREHIDSYFSGAQGTQGKGIQVDDADDDGASTVVEGPIEGSIALVSRIQIHRRNP